MPVNTGPVLTELAAEERLEETTAAELDERLEETTTAELDDLLDGATELDAGTDEGAADDVVPPHADAVSCAPFLPTPANCASLSFTHCGVTGA